MRDARIGAGRFARTKYPDIVPTRRPPAVLSALLAAVAAAALAGVGATTARADTSTVSPSAGLPWTDPQHRGPLEQLASTIASHIAGRPVTVRCEGATDWTKLTRERGVDPDLELGYVGVTVTTSGGGAAPVITTETFTELSPVTCSGLQTFAQAAAKPTKCSPPITATTVVQTTRQVTTRMKVDLGPDPKHPGKRRTGFRTVTKTLTVPTQVTTSTPGPAVPCYTGGLNDPGRTPTFALASSTKAYIDSYAVMAGALETLAHEALHLGGLAGGTTRGGTAYGDPRAEAKAECGGMQWMSWVAEQLGATHDDAVALAQFRVAWVYPSARKNAPLYWSADCVAGGALDIRTDRSQPWPTGLS